MGVSVPEADEDTAWRGANTVEVVSVTGRAFGICLLCRAMDVAVPEVDRDTS